VSSCVYYTKCLCECQEEGEKTFPDTTLFRVRQRSCPPRLVLPLYHNPSQCQAWCLCFFIYFIDVSACQQRSYTLAPEDFAP